MWAFSLGHYWLSWACASIAIFYALGVFGGNQKERG
jgi:hypothetical protein